MRAYEPHELSICEFGRRTPALDEIPEGCHAVQLERGNWWYVVGPFDVLADNKELYMKGGF